MLENDLLTSCEAQSVRVSHLFLTQDAQLSFFKSQLRSLKVIQNGTIE